MLSRYNDPIAAIATAPGRGAVGIVRLSGKGLAPLVQAGVTPICMGGDHSITLGPVRALSRRYGPLGMLLLDAHHDVYDSYYDGRVRYNAGTHLRGAVSRDRLFPQMPVQFKPATAGIAAQDISYRPSFLDGPAHAVRRAPRAASRP